MAEPDATLVHLPPGAVRGRESAGVIHFRDIPYAAPPAGDRRFAPPRPPEPWTGERRPTGATAPQRTRAFPGLDLTPLIGSGWVPGDDYLTLDVRRPAGSATNRPVMVFVHGGGFIVGSKDASVHAGDAFARDGIVLVTINYRLGVDGFLPIRGVPTNLGLRDILAALAWVRDHIALFGGDPANVTAFGESAGAMALADLVASPAARGLFRRAILQSGHAGMTRPIPVAERLVKKLARFLHTRPDRAGFARVPQEEALDAVAKLARPATRLNLRGSDGREPAFGITRFLPVHGDDLLPLPPLEALAAGTGAEIDVLIGANSDEMNLYLVPAGTGAKANRLLAWLTLRRSQPRAMAVLKAYGVAGETVSPRLAHALTDLVFRAPVRRFAAAHRGRSWVYEFDWRSPRFGAQLGAAHGTELPFVFDTLASATGAEAMLGENPPQPLADRIHALWVRFATDGTLPWPQFTPEARHVHHLAADETVEEAPLPAERFL